MPQLIDAFMPRASLHEVDHVAVAADPSTVWLTVRAFDFYRIRWARALFRLRTLPERLFARLQRKPLPPDRTARIDDITGNTGFVILGEEAGREVVVGSVGKWWQPRIEFARVAPAEFADFALPGYGKLAWSLRVDPRPDGGSWITFDLRVGATDKVALARFRRYWMLIGRFSHALRHGLLRAYAKELGASTPFDDRRTLPGDELLPTVNRQRTHAITIEAPPAKVWPWLVQMGCQRAGFYSLDRLDNAGVPSAERIIAELQHIAIGDVIPWRPTGPDGFSVLRVEAERLLLLGSPGPHQQPSRPPPYAMTWAFVLDPVGASATRLTVRVRGIYDGDQPIRARMTAGLTLLAHEIMERAQLDGIKRRAETHAAA
jgi:hypothetical protein